MTGVEVIVPWRGGCPHRERVLRYVLARYEQAPVTVTVATHDEGPWVKALAVRPAVERSTAKVIVVADADCLAPLTGAVTAVWQGKAGWALPHTEVRRLNERATRAVIEDGAPPAMFGPGNGYAEDPYVGVVGGGILVATRDVLLDCPLDPRFEGWGDEDVSWGWALTTLHGRPWRGPDPLWHLWHPPQQREHRKLGSHRSLQLRQRYRQALGRRGEMRLLVDEHAQQGDPGAT